MKVRELFQEEVMLELLQRNQIILGDCYMDSHLDRDWKEYRYHIMKRLNFMVKRLSFIFKTTIT